MSTYPEHEKLAKIKDESQAIGEFLDNSGYTLCQVMYRAPFNGPGELVDHPTKDDGSGRFYPVPTGTRQILAEYFGIDQDKLETEKRQMLDKLKAANAK